MQIFDSTNAYVTADKVYGKMMKNLLYLLGAPFEIFVRIDSKMPVNPAKDDIAKDTIMHAMFYGSIHIEIALDLLKRLGPALKARIAEIDKPSAASNSTARDTAADKGKGAQRDAAEQPAQAQTVKAKQKGGAKQNARAKQPAQTKAKERVNKKRPAPETKARRPNTRSRPNASSPSVASMPVRVGRLMLVLIFWCSVSD